MRRLLINAPARYDLEAIDTYLRFEKCNTQAADRGVLPAQFPGGIAVQREIVGRRF